MQYVGQIVAAVAAETEEIATEAAQLVKVEYKPLEHQVVDTDAELSKGQPAKRDSRECRRSIRQGGHGRHSGELRHAGDHALLPGAARAGDGDSRRRALRLAFDAKRLAVMPIALERRRRAFRRTRFTSIASTWAAASVRSSAPDKWGTIGALLAKQTGRPVKLLLDRDLELMIAGNRPSAYAKIKVGATKDGTRHRGRMRSLGHRRHGRLQPAAVPVCVRRNSRIAHVVGKGIRTNRGGQRGWRAPSHPQGCFITMSALADLAAALKMDELEFFLKNLELHRTVRDVYREELKIAAELIGYKQKAHLRGDKTRTARSSAAWALRCTPGAARGIDSECDVTINPDGSVEAKIGTQDLGVGTRTCVGIVVAETLGPAAGSGEGEHRQELVSDIGRFRRQHDDRRHFGLVARGGDRGAQ